MPFLVVMDELQENEKDAVDRVARLVKIYYLLRHISKVFFFFFM